MDRLNFCMTNPFFHPYTGGTEKHMYELSKRLSKYYNLHVLTSRLPGMKKEEDINGVHVHRVKSHTYKMPPIYPHPLIFAWSARKRMRQLDKEENFDVINLHGRWAFDFGYSIKYGKKKDKFCTLTVHNKRPRGVSPGVTVMGTVYDAFYGRRIMKKADALIPVSHDAKEDLLNYHIPADKMHVIHNGVDTKFFRPSTPTYKDKYLDGFDNLLIFQGRIIRQKGLKYLMNAMPKILEEHPKTKLLIIGSGKDTKKIKRQTASMKLNDYVGFPGFIPEQDLPHMFSSADVFIMPSLWEVLPITLLEALSCGAPLVASNAGGNPEIVKHCKNGYIFDMKDSDTMAHYINKLLSDRNLRKKMGKESRNIALKEFDWDIITKQTIDFYNNALSGR